MKWFEKPMRIGALQCNFEKGSSLKVIDKWADLGLNVEQLFHPMAESYTALFNERLHGARLARYVARAHQRGLRIILYLNTHIIEPSNSHRRAQWAQRMGDGTYPKFYDTYYPCCINSPWRDYFFGCLEDLDKYAIDGIFLDGPALIGEGCHCPVCRARFQTWFGRPMGKGPAGFDFKWRTQADFLEETYRRFKRSHPDGLVYINMAAEHPRTSGIDIRKVMAWNDIVGTEGGFMFYGPPKNAWLWQPGYAARLLEAIAPAKSRVSFMAADQKPWCWYQHAAGETALCIASTSANGANVWYGLHSSTRMLKTPGGETARRMFHFLKRNENLYAGAASAARVALLHSYETDTAWGGAAAESDLYGKSTGGVSLAGDPHQAVTGMADMITREHIPYDLITELDLRPETLDRYDCIVLSGSPCMSQATAGAFRRFVRRGGNLVAAFTASLHDEQGRVRKDFALGEVFGVRAAGHITNYPNFNYIVPRPGAKIWFDRTAIPMFPAPELAVDVRTRSGSRVLADFLKPLAGRYVPLTGRGLPAIVLNRYGRGRCLYLAGAVGEWYSTYTPPEYQTIVGNALNLLARSPVRLENVTGPVEVVVRRQADRLLIHLVNHSSFSGRPITKVETLRNVELLFPGIRGRRRVKAVASGRALPARQTPAGLRVTLPELREYEVVTVG